LRWCKGAEKVEFQMCIYLFCRKNISVSKTGIFFAVF
jgi:hypothetical protein